MANLIYQAKKVTVFVKYDFLELLKMEEPQVTMGFNTKTVKFRMIWGYPHDFGNPSTYHSPRFARLGGDRSVDLWVFS